MASDSPRLAEMFPTLDDVQIERIRAVGHERAVHAGEILFEQGEAATKFFVVLEGSIEVVHPDRIGEHVITVHEPGGFTGEINMLAGTRSVVLARARTAGRTSPTTSWAATTVRAGRGCSARWRTASGRSGRLRGWRSTR